MFPSSDQGVPFIEAIAAKRKGLPGPSLVEGSTPQHLKDIEPYCPACYDIILHWQRERKATQQLHSSVAELVACGKSCKLCRYICSLYSDLNLEGILEPVQSLQSVWITQDSQESWTTSWGILKTVVITVDICSPLLGTNNLGRKILTVVTNAGTFRCLDLTGSEVPNL
jgi:hypothetical protein